MLLRGDTDFTMTPHLDRWDAAGGAFYFVDPKDDMLVVFMVEAPEQGGRIQLALKTLMYEAMGRGLRKD